MTDLLIRPVNGAKKPVPLHRCGNCYWHTDGPPGQTEVVTCQAIPPTPMLAGVAQDALGRPVPQIINAWPQLPADQRMCRLWTASQGPKDGEQLA